MNIRSAKAKGRRCAVELKELLHKYAPDLKADDFIVNPASVPGPDLLMSPAAKEIYNLAIECKNQESIQIWAALEQAQSHVKGTEIPALFFRRNRTKLYVALEAEHFVKLIR